MALLGGATDVCAVENATSAEYVRLLLKGGFKLETLKRTKLQWPTTLRYILEAAEDDVKKEFRMSEIIGCLDTKKPYSFIDSSQSAEFVVILCDFKFEPDVEGLKNALTENRWKESPCGGIGGALVSFGFLKMIDLPPCCLNHVELLWRPISGVHGKFPNLHDQVEMTLLVLKRLAPLMPKDLRNKVLVMAFGHYDNHSWRSLL